MRSYLLLLPLVACLIAVGPDAPVAAQEKDPPADGITPIASGITEFPTTFDIDGQKIAVALAYAKQGNTVFVLPAWHVRAVRRLTDGLPAAKLLPSDLLVSPDAKGEQRLEFDVVNLLEFEAVEKAIQDKLKARIAQQSGQPTDKLAFAVPQVKPQSYRFTLIGPGRGDDVLPAEVPISPDFQRLPSGVVRLTFKPDALKAVEKENGGPLKLAQAHLRAVGLMRVRFEQTQVVAQVEFIRGAMTELRKTVTSIKDSQGRTPEAFVEMPDGGSAASDNQIRQFAQQSLSVTISARSGADTAPILALVQTELNGLIDRNKIKVSEEEKRVAVLLDKQVTISGTMGEIHKLAKQDEKQRDEAFKAAFEDHQARSYGRASSYTGSVSVNILGFGGGIGGGTSSASNESQEDRTKREMEVAKKQFDRVMKEFAGRVPMLTGISLDDATLSKSFEQVSKNFEDKKLTTGDSLHRWPLIALGGQADTALSPQELVRQYALLKGDFEGVQRKYAELKADHEALRKLVGTPQQLVEAKANMERMKQLAGELEAALSKFDQSAIGKVQKEIAKLKRQVGGGDFAGRAEEFVGLEANERPPGLDCTGASGADAATVLAAQKAWAAFLKEKNHEKAFALDKAGKAMIDMILLPPGKYWRGEPGKDAMAVTLTQPLWVGKYEVTQAQYEAVAGKNPSKFKMEGADAVLYPVETVDHDMATAFGKKASEDTGAEYRLLRESEWEYAYRAGTRTKFYSGDDDNKVGDIAQYNGNNDRNTEKVGSKAANAFGLYDMAGNVWEWCADWYGAYDTAKTTDPRGAESGSDRVYRGGGWGNSAEICRAAYRNGRTPASTYNGLGLRLARVPSAGK